MNSNPKPSILVMTQQKKSKLTPFPKTLRKAPTGIRGLDEITEGGFPAGRPTLVCGGAGCGKTLLAMEFLVRGAAEYDEPGVFMAFEETGEELTENVAALGFDLAGLVKQKKLLLDHVHVERSEFEETGEYDLEGLFIRLGYAIDSIKAKRVVLDTIEGLFASLPNQAIVRAELRRLFRWLKDKGVTVIMTGERGEGTLTRYGLEEYVSDCVISLDHRVVDQVTTRRIRVVKYRGTTHGTNEYPFLIEKDGISIWPVTSVQLEHKASNERIPTGIERLDTMLGGKGFYRGSSILLSGTAGTGKTSVAATFIESACRRGEKALYFSFEESPSQIMRNMGTIGLDLTQWTKKGLLHFETVRPFHYGLEMHLARTIKAISEFGPSVVIIDPISGLDTSGTPLEVKSAMMRLLDYLKQKGITAMLTDLKMGGAVQERRGFSDFLARGYLDGAARSREQRRAQPRPARDQVARHGPFQSGPGVRPLQRRHPTDRRVHRAERYAHRLRARGAGGTRTGGARKRRRRSGAAAARPGVQTRRAGGPDRGLARRVFGRRSHAHANRQQGSTARGVRRFRQGRHGPQPPARCG